MRICLVGCAHGNLDYIYQQISYKSPQTDLVLIAGDFQAIRDENDLSSMAVPKKYRAMGDFEQYYNKTKQAPFLTIIIGGNHESSRYMQEMPDGGWIASSIYYLGRTGVVDVGGITIGGISGVYAPEHYDLPHFEQWPFDEKSIRSVYHVRKQDTDRILEMRRGKIDIMISHDWPAGIERYGNLEYLLAHKRFLQEEINSGTFGSVPAMKVLVALQPKIWLSAHMHIKYLAEYSHKNRSTQFIALDKALPKRKFLHFIDMDPEPSTSGSASSAKQLKVRTNKYWARIESSAKHGNRS